MLVKISPELKSAILALPEREKEKLLMRLIRKDKTLINQLHFQLLEDEDDLEERRAKTLKHINSEINKIRNQGKKSEYYNPRELLLDLRSMSGFVNEHCLITKDKPGEVEFRLYILSEIFSYAGRVFEYENYANEKLLRYVTGRIKNIFTTYNKLHEDLQYDYKERINEVLKFAHSSAIKNYLKEMEIPKEV